MLIGAGDAAFVAASDQKGLFSLLLLLSAAEWGVGPVSAGSDV